MIIITRIRLSPQGTGHEHITEVEWEDRSGSIKEQRKPVQFMIDMMWKFNAKVYVRDGANFIPVEVIDDRYLRTRADGKLSNNLLELEKF